MRHLVKQYPNESDEQLQDRFVENLLHDPATLEAIRKDIFAGLLRELEDGKAHSDMAGKQITGARNSLETSIRNNPIASVAVAAAIGFLYAMIRRQWFIGDGM